MMISTVAVPREAGGFPFLVCRLVEAQRKQGVSVPDTYIIRTYSPQQGIVRKNKERTI